MLWVKKWQTSKDLGNDVPAQKGSVGCLAVSAFEKDATGKASEAGWQYSVGRMTQDMAKEHLFPATESALALFCGPPPMITYACKPFCSAMGYTDETMVIF